MDPFIVRSGVSVRGLPAQYASMTVPIFNYKRAASLGAHVFVELIILLAHSLVLTPQACTAESRNESQKQGRDQTFN